MPRKMNAQKLAGDGGFEPPLADPESAVLPLDESPKKKTRLAPLLLNDTTGGCVWQGRGASHEPFRVLPKEEENEQTPP
jgi:hypothetical protein